jgi:hypothetical protein
MVGSEAALLYCFSSLGPLDSDPAATSQGASSSSMDDELIDRRTIAKCPIR